MVAGAWVSRLASYPIGCTGAHRISMVVRRSTAAADQFYFLPRRLAHHVVLQARKSRRLNMGGGSAP